VLGRNLWSGSNAFEVAKNPFRIFGLSSLICEPVSNRRFIIALLSTCGYTDLMTLIQVSLPVVAVNILKRIF